MEPEKIEDNNDESVLDQELEASLNALKAETLVEEVKPTETPEDPTSPDSDEGKPSEIETETEAVPKTEENKEFKPPVKGKFESEESFQKRIELANLVKQRKEARTAEDKDSIQKDIQNIRKDLSKLNSKNINNSLNPDEVPPKTLNELDQDEPEATVTIGEVERMLEEREFERSVKSTIQTFIERHETLKNDEDQREVFFDFVESDFNWQGKTGADLLRVLEMARETMFKPSESIQDRVLKSANVAEKVNAMQFPGGTITKPGLTPTQQKSVDEMVATGMSADKALELIMED